MRARVVLLFVPTAWVACFSQSSGGPGTTPSFDAATADVTESEASTYDAEPPDAALESSVDSSAPPVEAGPAPEAGPVDAGITDGPVDVFADVAVDAGPAPVVVIVGGARGYESGIPVVFGDASGNVLTSSTTDGTGQASFLLPTGGMVTVVLGSVNAPQLTTYVGVTPGQQIPVADPTSVGAFFLPLAVDSLPAAPGDASFSYYQALVGNCASLETNSLPLFLSLVASQSCIGFARTATSYVAVYPLLVNAIDGAARVQGYASSASNSLLSTDDLGQLAPALPASWSLDQLAQSVAVTGATGSPLTTFSEVVNGVLVPSHLGTGASAFTSHPSFASEVQVEAFYGGFHGSSGLSGTIVATSAAAPTTSGTFTLDGSLVAGEPAIGIPGGHASPGGLTISWSGNLSASMGVVIVAAWSGNTDAGQQVGSWTIVMPPTASTSLQTPTLPPNVTAYAPQVAGSIGNVTVYGVDGQTAFPSYPALLPVAPLFVNQDQSCGEVTPFAPVLPTGGTVLLSMAANTPNGC